jgi:hypothetical protein
MKTLRLLIAVLLFSASAGFAQTQSPANMVATYNAAQAFLATLSSSQSNSAVYSLLLTNARNWSNPPLGAATRNGWEFANLTSAQISATLNVATNALGTSGAWLFNQIRYADAILSANGGGSANERIRNGRTGLQDPSLDESRELDGALHHQSGNPAFQLDRCWREQLRNPLFPCPARPLNASRLWCGSQVAPRFFAFHLC